MNDIELKSLSAVDLSKENRDDKSYKVYIESLLWGIKNIDTKNIALMGTYGVGKSSVIKTLKTVKKSELPNNITVSLATFESEVDDNGKSIISDYINEEKISLSIVNQILYSKKKSDLTASRFKRIEYFDSNKKALYLLFIALFIYSIVYLFFPKLNDTISFLPHLGECTSLFFKLIFFISVLILIWKSLHFFTNLSISRISPTSIEVKSKDTDITINALDKYFDEILYFFQATKTKLVFIEDLDRFPNSLKIFTKLRELNFLLNQSEDLDGNITFVYAVKDDVIDNHNGKAKFFDLIIPIVPYINYSNSRDIFKKEFTKIEPSLNENESLLDLLKLVSRYIEDTRSILAIINDYLIMKSVLNIKEKSNDNINVKAQKIKLLAFTIYKTLYPEDYARLLKRDGILYGFFSNRKTLLHNFKTKLTSGLTVEKEELNNNEKLQKNSIQTIEDLKILFINGLLRIYKYNIEQVLKDLKIESIESLIHDPKLFDEKIINLDYYASIDNRHIKINKNILENIIGKHYAEEIKKIDYKNEIERYKETINTTNTNLLQIEMKVMQDLFKVNKSLVLDYFNELERNNRFKKDEPLSNINSNNTEYKVLTLLLEEGYISENFISYFSHKYDGVLSFSDQEFYQMFDYNKALVVYKVEQPQVLLKDLSLYDFKQKTILNHSLLTEIFNNEKTYERFKFAIIQSFLNYITDVEEDFFSYSEISYLNKLCSLLIVNSSFHHIFKKLSKEVNQVRLLNGIDSCKDEDIALLNNEEEFKTLIINNIKYFEAINSSAFKKIITNGNYLLADCISIKDNNKLKILLTSKAYVCNVHNVTYLIERIGTIIENYKPYSISNIIDNKEIKDYFLENEKEYIKDYLLKIEQNTNSINEKGQVVIDYLFKPKEEDFFDKNLELISQKIDFKIEDLSSLPHTENLAYLLKYNRVICSWENVYDYYKKLGHKFDDFLVYFLENNQLIEVDDFDNISDESFKISFVNSNLGLNSILNIMSKSIFIIEDVLRLNKNNDKLIKSMLKLNKVKFTKENFRLLNNENRTLFLKINNIDRAKIEALSLTSEECYELISYWISKGIDQNENDKYFIEFCKYFVFLDYPTIDLSKEEDQNNIIYIFQYLINSSNTSKGYFNSFLEKLFGNNSINRNAKDKFIQLTLPYSTKEEIESYMYIDSLISINYLKAIQEGNVFDDYLELVGNILINIIDKNHSQKYKSNEIEQLISALKTYNKINRKKENFLSSNDVKIFIKTQIDRNELDFSLKKNLLIILINYLDISDLISLLENINPAFSNLKEKVDFTIDYNQDIEELINSIKNRFSIIVKKEMPQLEGEKSVLIVQFLKEV